MQATVAETGLRTHEWVTPERRDVDRSGPAALVQRRFADGNLKEIRLPELRARALRHGRRVMRRPPPAKDKFKVVD